jgi:DUF1365 family protein
VTNAFEYGLFMLFVDLDELPSLFTKHPLWSVERANLACFRRRNYFGNEDVPLAEAVRDAVEEELGRRATGPIRLLTHFQYFGHCFNPVSFYYCYDATGETVDAIVAHITNTPWKERHAYILDTRANASESGRHWRFTFPKSFHVSPFMPMGVDYDWRFNVPGDSLNVHMVDYVGGERHFDATLRLQRRELSTSALTWALLRYPLMTVKVVAGIHWQALRLWTKRAPFYVNPSKREN